MNFFSGLKTAGKALWKVIVAGEPIAELGLSFVDPPAATMLHSVWGTLVNHIAATEQAIQDPGSGDAKKTAVMSAVLGDVDAALEISAQALQPLGLKVVYDSTLLEKANDLQVQAFNAVLDFKNSFKAVQVTPPITPVAGAKA